MAKKIFLDAGYPKDVDRNWARKIPTPFIASHLAGKIAGYEWLLGLRPDLGVDIQAEIDRFPDHRLRKRTAEEFSRRHR